MVEIRLKVPDEFARDAKEFDLLDEKVILEVLQTELEHRINDLVNDEIHAYRAEKRSRKNKE
jgi:hypothetical protein